MVAGSRTRENIYLTDVGTQSTEENLTFVEDYRSLSAEAYLLMVTPLGIFNKKLHYAIEGRSKREHLE